MPCTIEELRNICMCPGGVQDFPISDMDEVYEGLFVGNASSAADLDKLKRKNIGFVLNACYGRDPNLNLLEVHPSDVYQEAGIEFLGVPAIDMMSYNLEQHFKAASAFIKRGLRSRKGVLVHCRVGVSRSAALAIAYLVMEEGMDVKEATREVRSKREIFPNDGFLQQLCRLDEKMKRS